MIEQGIYLLDAARTLPLDQALGPVIEAVLVFGSLAIGAGVCIARLLTRKAAGKSNEDVLSQCRRHDWLRMDDGGYVCLRCSYRAGS